MRMKTFHKSGGRVVLVSPERSFLRNEVGTNRAGDGLKSPFAALPLSGVLQMAGDFDTALATSTDQDAVNRALDVLLADAARRAEIARPGYTDHGPT